MFKRTFQSTRPVRGATEDASAKGNKRIVSIHAPRAGRDHYRRTYPLRLYVSIHAPRAGRDAYADSR